MELAVGTAFASGATLEDMLRLPFAAEVRTATDRPRPRVDGEMRLARRRQLADQGTLAADLHLSADVPAVPPIPAADLARTFFSPWFSDTMQILSAAREAASAENSSLKMLKIDTAELLAAFLVEIHPDRQPQLMVDDDGSASYGTSIEGFYINLTVESPGKIAWYAVVGNEEFFEDDIPFNGRSLPQSLRDVFKLRLI
jgi:hypothetical protein